MTHKLTLTYAPEDDTQGELCASIDSLGFCGQGAAWFRADRLQSFCADLGEYPILSKSPPALSGGYWNDSGTVLIQTHLGLTIAPYGTRGSLLVSVQLSAPIWEFESHKLHRSVTTHFRTDYPSLDRFRASFLLALKAEGEAVTLHGL